MSSACMSEIESHLIKCVLPIWIPVTAFASLELLIIMGILRSVVCVTILRVLQRKLLSCACVCHPELGLRGEKVRDRFLTAAIG